MANFRSLAYYRYPQMTWSAGIHKLIARFSLPTDCTFVDAPCGDGVISYWLHRWEPRRQFELYDSSVREIADARKRSGFARAFVSDVREIPLANRTGDVWLLINSLYLLPDIDRIVDRLAPRMKYIVGLFPDITSANYRFFSRRFPRFPNINALTWDATAEFFEGCRYRCVYMERISSMPYHAFTYPGIWPVLSVLSLWLEPIARRVYPGQYFLALFVRRGT